MDTQVNFFSLNQTFITYTIKFIKSFFLNFSFINLVEEMLIIPIKVENVDFSSTMTFSNLKLAFVQFQQTANNPRIGAN